MRSNIPSLRSCVIAAICLFGVSTLGRAQNNERVYLDENLRALETQENASYYRTVLQRSTGYEVHVYYLDGKLKMTGSYEDPDMRVANGAFTFYHPNGQIESTGHFCANNKCGIWKRWQANGEAKADRVYPDPAKAYESAVHDEPAQFPGGYRNLISFVDEMATYPEEALLKSLEGTVKVSFQIDEGGLVRNVNVIQSAHYFLDRAALECVWQMPLWQPAQRNGQTITSKFILPLTFSIHEGKGRVRIGS